MAFICDAAPRPSALVWAGLELYLCQAQPRGCARRPRETRPTSTKGIHRDVGPIVNRVDPSAIVLKIAIRRAICPHSLARRRWRMARGAGPADADGARRRPPYLQRDGTEYNFPTDCSVRSRPRENACRSATGMRRAAAAWSRHLNTSAVYSSRLPTASIRPRSSGAWITFDSSGNGHAAALAATP
jgi:hypothetical protein